MRTGALRILTTKKKKKKGAAHVSLLQAGEGREKGVERGLLSRRIPEGLLVQEGRPAFLPPGNGRKEENPDATAGFVPVAGPHYGKRQKKKKEGRFHERRSSDRDKSTFTRGGGRKGGGVGGGKEKEGKGRPRHVTVEGVQRFLMILSQRGDKKKP